VSLGTPYALGAASTATAAAAVTAATSTALGDAIVVGLGSSSTASVITSVTDTQGNIYQPYKSNATAQFGAVWAAFAALPLTGGTDIITVTFTSATGQKNITALGCPGILGFGAAVDTAAAASANGTSTAPSATTGTLANSGELLVGLITGANAGGAPGSVTAGWTQIEQEHSGSNEWSTLLYQVAPSVTAVTLAAAITSAAWSVIIVPLIPTAAGQTAISYPVAGTSSWVPVAGIQPGALIEGWGPGGGSAGGEGTGGGAGAYAAVLFNPVAGTSYPVVTGAGGTAGTSTAAGGNGTPTSFNTSTMVAAPGGGGHVSSTAGAGGTTGASTGTTLHAGGASGTATSGTSGSGGGGSAGPAAAGNAGANSSGSGSVAGAVAVAGGGPGGPSGGSAGNGVPAPYGPGGGAGAGGGSKPGAAGLPGLVQITFTVAATGPAPVVPLDGPVGPRRGPGYWRRGRMQGSAGAPVVQPPITPAPVFPLRGPVGPARPPRFRRGSAQGSAGVPVTQPPITPAPVFPLRGPVGPARPPRFRRGSARGSAGVPVTINVVCGPAAGLLEGNELSRADSDFETWTGNWTAGPNTSVDQSVDGGGYTGCFALQMTATAGGQVSATSPLMPSYAGAANIGSGYMAAQLPGRAGQLTLTWYDAGFTPLATVTTSTLLLATATPWTPFAGNGGAPAGTAWYSLAFTGSGLTAGESVFADLVYAADSPMQVLISWNAPPLAVQPLFVDVTPWARADTPWTVGHGRQDNVTETQTGPLAGTIDNTSGWFTTGGSAVASPWAPGVKIGRRIQVNLPDEFGQFWTRFDGQLTEVPTEWTGANAAEAFSAIAASDLLALLNRLPNLATWTQEEMGADQPIALYALNDPTGSTQASDSAGNGAAPLVVRTYGAQPVTPLAWWQILFHLDAGSPPSTVPAGTAVPTAGIPLTETRTDATTGELSGPLPTWLFTPSASAVAQLEGPLPQPVTAAAGFSFECWANCTTPLAAQTLMMLGSKAAGAVIGVQVTAAGILQLAASSDYGAASPTFAVASAGTVPGPVTFAGLGSGTYTPGPGVFFADAQAWGFGNFGAGTNGVSGDSGGGGGGGEWAGNPKLPCQPGVPVPWNVGATTTIGTGALQVLAHAGQSGTSGGSPLGGLGGHGSTAPLHNNGGAGASVPGGGGGSSAGPGGPGNDATDTSGAPAVTGGGPGGDEDAVPATGPGGGGGGSSDNTNGQAGAAGQVQFTPLTAGQSGFHIAVICAPGGVATLYVNNQAAGSLQLPAGATYNWQTLGGPMGGGQGASGWNGSIGLYGVYGAALDPVRVATRFTAGTTGFAGLTTGYMISALARYCAIPPQWYTPPSGTGDPSQGLSTVSYMDLTGTQPLAQMQLYEQAEGGFLYASAAGRLTFADRAQGYAAGSAAQPPFVLTAGQYEQDTLFKSNDQYLLNGQALVARQS
jgi:hypothetical protein